MMPFLWRSKSKRKTKVKAPAPEPPVSVPACTVSNGFMYSINGSDGACGRDEETASPPKLPERNKNQQSGTSIASQNRRNSGFIMIRESYKRNVDNELDVQRGQIVRKLHAQDGWMFVKNVDGICGYVPSNICSVLEDMQDSANYETVPPLSTKLLVPTKSAPTSSFPYDSLPGTPSIDTPSPYSRQQLTGTPFTNITSSTSPPPLPPPPKSGHGTSPAYHIIERNKEGTSPPTVPHPLANMASPMLHPLHPRSITKYYELEGNNNNNIQEDQSSSPSLSASASPSSLSLQQPSTPAIQPLYMHLRTDSYQEAVVDESPRAEGPTAAVAAPTPGEPMDCLRIPQVKVQRPSTLHFNPNYDHLANYTATTTEGMMLDSTAARTCSSQLVDDVFLPATSKPCGIYRVLEYYEKKAAGELTVRENEYVIVVELGQGEWTTITNCCNEEGIVPRSILKRYTYNDSTVNAETQTELVVMGPVNVVSIPRPSPSEYARQGCSSAGTESVCMGEIPITHRRYSFKHTTEMAVQTDASPTIGNAWTRSQSHSIENLWYENSMSIPQLTGLDMGPGMREMSSIRTLPTFNDTRHECGNAPLAFHSSRHSLPQLPSLVNFPPLRKDLVAVQNGRDISSVTPISMNNNLRLKQLRSQERPPPIMTPPKLTNGYGRGYAPTPPITQRSHAPITKQPTPNGSIHNRHVQSRQGNATPSSVNGNGCRYSILSSAQDSRSSCTPTLGAINGRDHLDWPVSPETISNVPTSGLKPQMVVLTATKDFSPEVDGTSCMAVRKGDVLHLYPGNNVHQGWLWTYHVREEMYGFVPKSHTAFVYMTAGRLRQNLTLCDLV